MQGTKDDMLLMIHEVYFNINVVWDVSGRWRAWNGNASKADQYAREEECSRVESFDWPLITESMPTRHTTLWIPTKQPAYLADEYNMRTNMSRSRCLMPARCEIMSRCSRASRYMKHLWSKWLKSRNDDQSTSQWQPLTQSANTRRILGLESQIQEKFFLRIDQIAFGDFPGWISSDHSVSVLNVDRCWICRAEQIQSNVITVKLPIQQKVRYE